jgi:hypothetical protein
MEIITKLGFVTLRCIIFTTEVGRIFRKIWSLVWRIVFLVRSKLCSDTNETNSLLGLIPRIQQLLRWSRHFHSFTVSKCSVPCSQEPSIVSYSESEDSTRCPLWSVSTFSSCPFLCLRNCFFPLRFLKKSLYALPCLLVPCPSCSSSVRYSSNIWSNRCSTLWK